MSPQILQDFHSTNSLYQTLLISIWELGETVGPFFLGPLSEIYGRAAVANVSNFAFVAFCAGTAASVDIRMLIAFRFLTGGAVSSPFIGPGVVADMFPREKRGLAMSLISSAGTLGPAIGPIAGSYLGQYAGWQWTFWLPTIMQAVLSVGFLLIYRETYKVILLTRRARNVNDGGMTLQRVKKHYRKDGSVWKRLLTGITRPLGLLISSPVLALVALYSSLNNGLVYIAMTQIAPLFQGQYGFSEGASGIAYLGLFLGLLLGSLFCSFALDYYVKKVKSHLDESTKMKAELRLPPVVIGSVAMPVGLFGFGWSVQKHDHWILPIIFSGFMAFSSLTTSVSLSNYLVDAFGIYGVSAVSSMLIPRNAVGAFFPLVGPPLFRNLGYGWGMSLLGFIAVVFIPLPLLGLGYGERLRLIGKHKIVH